MPLQITVDGRPLNHPFSGIGRYTVNLLAEFERLGVVPDVRRCNGSKLRELLTANLAFGFGNKGHIFWSPRHHLPLTQPLNRIPSVVTVHDLVWKHARDTMPAARALYDRFLMSYSVQIADAIICVSQCTASDLITEFPSVEQKVEIIPLAPTVDPSMAANEPTNAKRPYALFVGTNEPRKNLARVTEAFKRHAKKSALQLIVVSNRGWLESSFEPHAQIEYQEEISDAQLAGLYRDCRFLIAPSLYEGFGLQVAEAMAFGKSIITSNQGALPEVCDGAGILVNPYSVDEIEAAIDELDSNEIRRTEFEAIARQTSANRSWRKVAESTLDVFERVLKS